MVDRVAGFTRNEDTLAGDADIIAIRSTISESVTVAVQRRRATEMGVKDLRAGRKIALSDQIDHALH